MLLFVEAVGLDRVQYPQALFCYAGWGGWLSREGLVRVFTSSSHTLVVSWGEERQAQTLKNALE